MMECKQGNERAAVAAGNVPVIKDGRMRVSTLPGLDLDQEYLKAMRADGEPWWGEE